MKIELEYWIFELLRMEENVVLFYHHDSDQFLSLFNSNDILKVDLLDGMLDELTLNKFPNLSDRFSLDFSLKRNELLIEKVTRVNGVWIYYPWRKNLVRILDEEDFVFLRTIRNRDKITEKEQNSLLSKTIGIVGLSVGYSVLMSIALERIAGTIRIADFDTLDLSNLNRIFHSIFDLESNKAVIAKRKILELDPYLKVEIYNDGVTSDNIDDFFYNEKGNLDLVIDECDNGFIKLLIREQARKKLVPVVMETSDRSVLDIERYDLDPNYPFLHGMLEGIDRNISTSRDVLMRCIDFSKVSERGRLSMSKVGTELRSWPQLASDVIIGGGSACAAARKILLGQSLKSQRIYFDIESQIS
jgi:molybdopterin/thiamine biosynthesis adenylyltransferase